jgi:hypothetical protein
VNQNYQKIHKRETPNKVAARSAATRTSQDELQVIIKFIMIIAAVR